MPKVQPTTTVTIDDKSFQLSELSTEVQGMVALFDEWRQEETDLLTDVMKVRGAIRDLQTQLLAQIKKDLEPKDEAAGDAPASE